jgi:site-specific recombinase XerD
MQLRGLSARTQETYVRVVRQLAEYYHQAPDQLGEEELRQYFLYLKNDKQLSRSSCTQALSGLKFFYQQSLGRDWAILDFIRPAPEHKLPVVLSVEEVRRLLGSVRVGHYRVSVDHRFAGLTSGGPITVTTP